MQLYEALVGSKKNKYKFINQSTESFQNGLGTVKNHLPTKGHTVSPAFSHLPEFEFESLKVRR